MGNNNYNKYFKTKEEKQNTKEVKENTNDKNISGTSINTPLINDVKAPIEIQTEVKTEIKEYPPKTTKAAVVSTYKLNVRQEPNKLSDVLCILDPGTNIMVDSINGDWVHIYTEHGIEGYVMKEYIIISRL